MLLTLLLAALPAQDPALLLADETWRFPRLGLSVHENRWLDPASGTIRRLATLADGTRVDLDALRRQEFELEEAVRGKISPELAERIGQAAAGSPLHVVFWLERPGSPDFRGILKDAEAAGMSGEDARRATRDVAEDYHRPLNQAFADWVGSQGHEVTQVCGPWPVVYALVPAGRIAALAADERVDEAYFCFPTWEPELDNAQGTMRTPIVWDGGLTAAGSPVKVMVNDPGHVSQSNPNLPPIIRIYGNGGTASHATACAGNIGFNHPTYKGAAYGIPQIYSADGSGDTGAPLAWNAAISTGVSFGNCSWWNGSKGSIVYLDRFFDYTLRNYAMMMFKSTGNQGTTSTPYTTTPGNGYNSTNSGSYNDGNNTNWAGDAMASYSSYWDPVEGHEKPELASPGDDVDTAGTSTIYYGFGGTSSASPLTCGVATLMASRDPSLMTQPETVKAVLMASAWHNIEGDDVLSEKDGAGGVHALAADAVVKRGNFVNGTLTAADFSNPNNAYDVRFLAGKGSETRVCALWFSNANSSYSTDVLDMDVDLVILDPAGNSVASSANTKNGFEILKFTPTTSGWHTARLVKQRFNGASEPFCVTWSAKYDSAEAVCGMAGSPRIGATVSLEFEARFQPGKWYQARLSRGTLPKFVSLGSGHILPVAQDGAYAWSASQPGFAGTLNASGQASATASIPNNPAMIGQTYYLAMYVKANSSTSVVDTVSEAFPFTILP
ncbi:MAG: S8 family serine peptidase [Planctomycetes bacterium]|nr:S8 family serine peptidase [Planctomycetota bacterium]